MAAETQADSASPPPLEQLRPTFNARRFVAPSAGFDADSPRTVPSPAEGGWRWIGNAETLGEFGAQAGQQVEPDAYERVERGQHPETHSRVRKANTVQRHLDDPERAAAAKGKESSHLHGLVHLSGSYGAPAAMEQVWRQGGPEDREIVKNWLIEETNAGIARISKTDRVAAAGVVRDEEGAGLRVDWVAVAADRGKGIETRTTAAALPLPTPSPPSGPTTSAAGSSESSPRWSRRRWRFPRPAHRGRSCPPSR